MKNTITDKQKNLNKFSRYLELIKDGHLSYVPFALQSIDVRINYDSSHLNEDDATDNLFRKYESNKSNPEKSLKDAASVLFETHPEYIHLFDRLEGAMNTAKYFTNAKLYWNNAQKANAIRSKNVKRYEQNAAKFYN
jgi:hypothetical protein